MSMVMIVILGAIFIGVSLVIIFRVFRGGISTIESALGSLRGEFMASNVERAILCAIYRCVEGCLSENTKKISWKSGDRTVYCRSEEPGGPCSAPGVGETHKVCDENYPVIVKLGDKEEKIDKNNLFFESSGYKGVSCILPSGRLIGFGYSNPLDAIRMASWGSVWIIVNNSLISEYGGGEQCSAYPAGMVSIQLTAYQSLSLHPNSEIEIRVKEVEGPFGTRKLGIYVKPKS